VAISEWTGPDRRAYRRFDAAFPIRLSIEVETEGSPQALGHSINISRGGVLAKVDSRMSLLAHCRVFFLEAGDTLRPATTTGVVRRVHLMEDGFAVAIQFDVPLEELLVVPTLWAKKRIDL